MTVFVHFHFSENTSGIRDQENIKIPDLRRIGFRIKGAHSRLRKPLAQHRRRSIDKQCWYFNIFLVPLNSQAEITCSYQIGTHYLWTEKSERLFRNEQQHTNYTAIYYSL